MASETVAKKKAIDVESFGEAVKLLATKEDLKSITPPDFEFATTEEVVALVTGATTPAGGESGTTGSGTEGENP